MKKIIAIFSLLAFGTSFSATISTELSFTVESNGFTGPMGYGFICGAGFRHQNASDANLDMGFLSWDYFDFISGEVKNGGGSSTSPGTSNWVGLYPATYDIATLSDISSIDRHEGTEDNKLRITDSSLILSSSQYGVEWFIDVCNYRRYPETDVLAGIYAIVTGVNGLTEGANYIEEANVSVSSETACDGQTLSSHSPDMLAPGSIDFGTTPTSGSEEKCVTRFYFKENSTDPRIGHLKGDFTVHTDYTVL